MDIVVVGSCNMDLQSFMKRAPKAGETLHGSKFCLGFGGKGANQCICAARLGIRTAMVSKVGDDTFGSGFLNNFKENGVNIDHVGVSKECATGVATILVEESGQNYIVIVAGANMELSEEDILSAEDLIKNSKVVVCQLEISMLATLTALKLAKKHGVTCILNPAPAASGLDKEMFTLPDIFCPNELEAESLTGIKVSSVVEAEAALDKLLDMGCNKAIITLGDKGCVFASKDDKIPKHIPAQTVSVVDTTGAGDAFVGGLAYFLSQCPSMSLREMLKRAVDIASVSVQSSGTQTSYRVKKDYPKEIFLESE